jgi:leader peptidase (prepilin peptidase)/N-methyltransferase
MWPAPEPLFPLVVGVVGWLWGSFLNQLADRTPRRPVASQAGEPGDAGARRPGLFSPLRSICLACRASIPWYDNVPILSYLVLRGRCRRCGASIGARTLVVEAATPAGFVGLLLLAPGPLGLGPAFPWGYLGFSWAVVAVVLVWERRRISPGFLLLGVCCGAGTLLASG